MASASNVASGPMMAWTRLRSISSCVRVLAWAGLPPVSAMVSSTLRPASVLLRSLRNSRMPCSICAPPAASGPVRTVRNPRRSGSPCAAAGSEAAAVIAATTNETKRAVCIKTPPFRQALISPSHGQQGDHPDDVQLRTELFLFEYKNSEEEKRQEPEGRPSLPLPQPGSGGEGGAAQPGAARGADQVRQPADARDQRKADEGPRRQAFGHRLAAEGDGPRRHRHPGGVAGAEPDLLLDRSGAGRRARAHGERAHRANRGEMARSVRVPWHRALAGPRSCRFRIDSFGKNSRAA